MNQKERPNQILAKRFKVSRWTLWMDWLMGAVIRVGGIAVVLALFGVFYFIAREAMPLFQPAHVALADETQGLEVDPEGVMGVDEWGRMPFFYDGRGGVQFLDIRSGEQRELHLPELAAMEITAVGFDPTHQRVVVGTAEGQVGSFIVRYHRRFADDMIEAELVREPWYQLTVGDGPVSAVSFGDGGRAKLIAVKRGAGDDASLVFLRLHQTQPLIGEGSLSLVKELEVNQGLNAEITGLKVSSDGMLALVALANGDIMYFHGDSGGVNHRQTIRPFRAQPLARVDFLLGDESVILTAVNGQQEQWNLYRRSEGAERQFGRIRVFPKLKPGAFMFAASQRSRSFLSGSNRELSIWHTTTGAEHWTGEIEIDPVMVAIDGKGEHFFAASADGAIIRYDIHDPHPEASVQAFFGKVWYEGSNRPSYQWQSTGGADDFEPKLSLVPLLIGSLKGTLYALIFSVPLALSAAIFSAAFLPAWLKSWVKPIIEVMASLPSVVLGFLAGMWLAPLLESRVPSVLLTVMALPVSALLLGAVWGRLPITLRNLLAGGWEWLIVLPYLAFVVWFAWQAGPWLESWLFVAKDPSSGKEIADFRVWWPQVTGLAFEQRNSLILGFIMGFAVIPVIFTIAEDALSNVPKSLSAGAAALGANRWQVVWTVMLPVASSGIFSALMIGFGRAVGETMIMVMATGNTPVTDWNLFNGMRTLAANIAVELPEAAVGSTHYRTLFLGALCLFGLTFILNTLAEILRQRLRERYKLV